METLPLFLLESLVSLALSLAIIRYLRDVMYSLLEAACPQGGAQFWLKTLALLQLLAPLLLVVWQAEAGPVANPVAEIKAALSWMLLGHCVSLLLIARIVWKSLVAPAMAKPGVQP